MQSVVNDIFYSVYQYLGFGILFAVVSMLALPEIKKNGIKLSIFQILKKMRKSKGYRYQFLFFIYLFMILSRTLICRNIWKCPWENIIGEWWIYTSEGKINIEGFLNVILFLPLTYLGVHGFMLKKIGSYKNKEIILIIVKMSFLFSCIIESLQLFLRLGTFQLSDIFQNTLGGFMGVTVCIIEESVKNQKKI